MVFNSLIIQWGYYIGNVTWGVETTQLPVSYVNAYSLTLTRENDNIYAFTNSTQYETLAGTSISSYINKTLSQFQHQSLQTLTWITIGF